MMLGSIPLYAVSSASYYPSTLSLTGWWRASFVSSPWSGTPSLGTSGSNTLSEATNPPASGTVVNGLAPADFDGVNDNLTASGTMDTYFASQMVCGWVAIYIDTDVDHGIISSSGGDLQLSYLAASNEIEFMLMATAPVYKAVATGGWHLVTFRYNGTNVQVGVDEAPGASGGTSTSAYSGFVSLVETVSFGTLDGKILEAGFSDTELSNTDYTDIKSYVTARYALSL